MTKVPMTAPHLSKLISYKQAKFWNFKHKMGNQERTIGQSSDLQNMQVGILYLKELTLKNKIKLIKNSVQENKPMQTYKITEYKTVTQNYNCNDTR